MRTWQHRPEDCEGRTIYRLEADAIAIGQANANRLRQAMRVIRCGAHFHIELANARAPKRETRASNLRPLTKQHNLAKHARRDVLL